MPPRGIASFLQRISSYTQKCAIRTRVSLRAEFLFSRSVPRHKVEARRRWNGIRTSDHPSEGTARMPEPSIPNSARLPDHFKALGARQVALMMSLRQIPPAYYDDAIRWLSDQGQKKESSEEGFRRRDLAISTISAAAAIVAAMAAIAAAIITAIK